MQKMNPVVHFEMPASDKNRMIEFYSNTFGWQTEQLGPEMGDYVLVSTSERGENGFPKYPGMINGGFYQKTEDPVSNYPSVVISVDNINESVERIKTNGGKILGEVMDIPGVGLYVAFFDTEGNRTGMLQPLPMMK